MNLPHLGIELLKGLAVFTWGNAILVVLGGLLVAAALARKIQPALLIPLGFGCLAANLGWSNQVGLPKLLYSAGVPTDLLPLLALVALGSLMDFEPLLANPALTFLAAPLLLGIFVPFLAAVAAKFAIPAAAAVGLVGALNGPAALFVANRMAPQNLDAVGAAALLFPLLIPTLFPIVSRWLARRWFWRPALFKLTPTRSIRTTALVAFPLIVMGFIGLLAPDAFPLVGALMLGNLLRLSGNFYPSTRFFQHGFGAVVMGSLGLTIGFSLNAASLFRKTSLLFLLFGLLGVALDFGLVLLLERLVDRSNAQAGAQGETSGGEAGEDPQPGPLLAQPDLFPAILAAVQLMGILAASVVLIVVTGAIV